MSLEKVLKLTVNGNQYLITPMQEGTFDVNIGLQRLGIIQSYILHGKRCWTTTDSIHPEDLKELGKAIEKEMLK